LGKVVLAKRFWEVLHDYYIGMVSVKEKRRGPSKYKRHWLVLEGRDDLYFKDEIAVDFKPYNKSYLFHYSEKTERALPSHLPSVTIESTTHRHLFFPLSLPRIPSSYWMIMRKEWCNLFFRLRK